MKNAKWMLPVMYGHPDRSVPMEESIAEEFRRQCCFPERPSTKTIIVPGAWVRRIALWNQKMS